MSTRPLLDLHDLRITRGRTTILAGLDWTVRRGEHWVILGPNGAGKTTLLRCMAALDNPIAGEITASTSLRSSRGIFWVMASAIRPARSGFISRRAHCR